MLDGTLDIACVRSPLRDEGLELRPLYTESRVVMLPAGHRLGGKPECA